MKHAYLIIAHNEPKLFHVLLKCLDDIRNDLFVLIDKKSELNQFVFHPLYSNIYYVDRIDIRWGDYSQVEAELLLMESAISRGGYNYYHLLSGVDLPLKSQDFIHHFFDSLNNSKELVAFVPEDSEEWKSRIWYFIPLMKYQRSNNYLIRMGAKCFNKVSVFVQKFLGIKRKWGLNVRKGTNWFSITDKFCRYVCSQKEDIRKMFSKVPCCDEVFLQTLLFNKYPERIYSTESEFAGIRRAIDWDRGLPYVWGQDEKDYDILMKSDKLFARKFSMQYAEIVNKIANSILCLSYSTE